MAPATATDPHRPPTPTALIPELDDFGPALESERADCAGAEREPSPGGGLHLEPSRGQDPEDVTVRERQRVAVAGAGAQPLDRAVRPRADLPGCSPPGHPSRHRFQFGFVSQICGVVRPSYSP